MPDRTLGPRRETAPADSSRTLHAGFDLESDQLIAGSPSHALDAGDSLVHGAVPAFVVSLDFELHWGVRDIHAASSSYTANLLGAREAIPRMLDLFVEHGIAATWATVGFLFAESREEFESFHPTLRPEYDDPRLDPYREVVGWSEIDDPLHYASSLVRLIAATPGQEIGTHTYSHFYCLESGATAEAFRKDIESAIAIARARNVEVRSIVLPRNQWNPAFAPILADAGIECYRGTQQGWMYDASSMGSESRAKRASRLLDAHFPLTRWNGTAWRSAPGVGGLYDIPATCFLRPVSGGRRGLNELRLKRITGGMTRAAREHRIFHLWWHPHNFGSRTSENLAFLRSILEYYREMTFEYGMQSMSMIDAARHRARMKAARTRGDNG